MPLLSPFVLWIPLAFRFITPFPRFKRTFGLFARPDGDRSAAPPCARSQRRRRRGIGLCRLRHDNLCKERKCARELLRKYNLNLDTRRVVLFSIFFFSFFQGLDYDGNLTLLTSTSRDRKCFTTSGFFFADRMVFLRQNFVGGIWKLFAHSAIAPTLAAACRSFYNVTFLHIASRESRWTMPRPKR